MSLAAFATITAYVQGAAGAVPCDSLQNPVVLAVDAAERPLVERVARRLRDSSAQPLTLVFVTQESCDAIAGLAAGVKLASNASYVPSIGEDPTWAPGKPTLQCDAAGAPVQVAGASLFPSSCPTALPSDVGSTPGAKRASVFVVPSTSSQMAITAEEAYFAFGFGSAGMAMPWTDELHELVRPSGQSTLMVMAASIHVPPSKWKGVQEPSSNAVISGLLASSVPESTIGIVGQDVYPASTSGLRALAFRTFGQHHAYYPSSAPGSADQRNVRDGHYVAWSTTTWLQHMSGSSPVSADAAYAIAVLSGGHPTPAPDFEPLDEIASAGLVPACAMKVNRSGDGADLFLEIPAEPCGCHFESTVGASSGACVPCVDATPCGAGACRFGFCEVK